MNIVRIVIDCETGGLDPLVNAILSIALLVVETGERLCLRIKAGAGLICDAKALQINGLDPNEGIDEVEACHLIHEFLLGKTWIWVGANPRFDYEFISALMRRTGVSSQLDYHLYDTGAIALLHHWQGKIELPTKYGKPSNSLDSCVKAYGIENLRQGTHGAEIDVEMTAAVFERQLSL